MNNTNQLAVLLLGFLLGIIVSLILAHPPGTNTFYKKSVVVLYDPECDICTPELNRFVTFLENNLPSAKNVEFIWWNVRSGAGARTYEELVKEKNVFYLHHL
jgi:predicted DCC family thiol-disulfide oxidoreductase YuxK